MKTRNHKEKAENEAFRSFADFRKRFYPRPVERDIPELLDPDEIGTKLAKESLSRLEEALTA